MAITTHNYFSDIPDGFVYDFNSHSFTTSPRMDSFDRGSYRGVDLAFAHKLQIEQSKIAEHHHLLKRIQEKEWEIESIQLGLDTVTKGLVEKKKVESEKKENDSLKDLIAHYYNKND